MTRHDCCSKWNHTDSLLKCRVPWNAGRHQRTAFHGCLVAMAWMSSSLFFPAQPEVAYLVLKFFKRFCLSLWGTLFRKTFPICLPSLLHSNSPNPCKAGCHFIIPHITHWVCLHVWTYILWHHGIFETLTDFFFLLIFFLFLPCTSYSDLLPTRLFK